MKLPKQWLHWCMKATLKPHTYHSPRGYGGYGWFYLKGHGRYWRVDDDASFQCGDTYLEFDRWALCDIVARPLPKTEKEFMQTVKDLLKEKDTI